MRSILNYNNTQIFIFKTNKKVCLCLKYNRNQENQKDLVISKQWYSDTNIGI